MLSPDECTELVLRALGIREETTGLTFRHSTLEQAEAYFQRLPNLQRLSAGIDYDERFRYLVAYLDSGHAQVSWMHGEGPWRGLLYQLSFTLIRPVGESLGDSPVYQRLTAKLRPAPRVEKFYLLEWLGKGVVGKRKETDIDVLVWADDRFQVRFRNVENAEATHAILECWDSGFVAEHEMALY